jgi:amidase
VNPFDRRFSPGGSSSGSAVGVAAGLSVASVGTETSGSLIAPASFNGVVAVKPSRGAVPGTGVLPLVRHQDIPGPVARCLADAAAMLQVMTAGAIEARLSPDALRDVRVGVLRTDVLAQRSPHEDTRDNDAILARIDRGLAAAGARSVDVTLGEAAGDAYEKGFAQVLLGGLTHDTMGELARVGAPASTVPELHAWNLRRPRSRMPWGQLVLSLALVRAVGRDDYERAALRYRALASDLLEAAFQGTGAVMLVSLSNRHSSVYATAGYPAVSVPLGLRANGMPVGATLIGRFDDDARLLGWAYALEQATRLRVAPPEGAEAV